MIYLDKGYLNFINNMFSSISSLAIFQELLLSYKATDEQFRLNAFYASEESDCGDVLSDNNNVDKESEVQHCTHTLNVE